MSALRVQELVDRCIDFLDSSDPTLRACALVSRSWVHPAQDRIFSEIEFERVQGSDQLLYPRASRLLDTLDASPHLTRYIVTLEINNRTLSSSDHFVRLCNLPFTRLASLHLVHLDVLVPDSAVSIAIKRILALPTIRDLDLTCRFTDREQFLGMWEHCSTNLKILALSGQIDDDQAAPPVDRAFAPRRSPMTLDAFKVTHSLDIMWWLEHPCCPLDFSGLKALHFRQKMDVLQRGILAPTLQTVEVLSVASLTTDLSVFERITDLHLFWTLFARLYVLPVLTISPHSRAHLRALRFRISANWATIVRDLSGPCAEIRAALSGLEFEDEFPNFSIVHISAAFATPGLIKGAEHYFPLLHPRISVQWNFRPDQGTPWYQTIV
ncbi:hypothetical protein B0H17DRAFT_122879 [Mycena rosella]|uniref:F-box domain-containing protein n=1 Tax=Mycena rosella TaxID=1033263 RepID=A0AAD7G842_MYCRO|nr:hypothetical protein B0H17DRAFT_122879 [Mycena rosella]